MKFIKLKLCFFILSQVCIYSNAQINITVKFPGKELIEYPSGKRTIDYSYDSVYLKINGEERYYYPEEIEYIKTDELYLISKIVHRNTENKKEFIQPIIKGFISLYQSRNLKGEKCFYLQKGDSTIYSISKNFYKGYIYTLFSDCEKLHLTMEKESLDNIGYNLSDIFDLVTRYNKYMEPDSVSVVYKEPSLLFKKYFLLGSTITTIKLDGYPYAGQKFTINPAPYIGFNFGLDYLDRYGFTLGLNYTYIKSKSGFTAKGSRFNDKQMPIVVDVDINLDFSLHCLEFPIALYFKPFKFKNVSPYIETGAMLNFIIKNGSGVTADDNYKPVIDYTDVVRLNTFNITEFLNVGTEISKFSRTIRLNLGISNLAFLSNPITSYTFDSFKTKIKFNQYSFSLRIFL